MILNRVNELLSRNEVVLSMIVRLVRGVEIAGIAKTAGLHSMYVDLEHGSFSLETTSQICIACQFAGITPFVRVPSLDAELIARVLDGGALGIVAPHIEDKASAEALVQAAKYAPVGTRSYSSSQPALNFRPTHAAEAMRALNSSTTLIAMIESDVGVERAHEIASVEGIDILHIGTNDLSNTLGVPGELDHALVRNAYRRVWEACSKYRKHLGVGGLAPKPEFAAELIQMGARYLTTGSDLGFLLGATSDRVRQFQRPVA